MRENVKEKKKRKKMKVKRNIESKWEMLAK
jgi:hypothetical protein